MNLFYRFYLLKSTKKICLTIFILKLANYIILYKVFNRKILVHEKFFYYFVIISHRCN